MKRRVVEWCLMALPRKRRERDGAVLRDLALDLSADGGFAREVWGLLRCGTSARVSALRQRIGASSIRRRVAALTLAAVAASALLVPIATGQETIEVERLVCAPGACGVVERSVGRYQRDGWRCERDPDPARGVEWTCRLT